jgi:hypothetical protein
MAKLPVAALASSSSSNASVERMACAAARLTLPTSGHPWSEEAADGDDELLDGPLGQ